MKIYIAGSFSSEQERESLKYMISLVRKVFPDTELYIPMELKVKGDFQKPDGSWNLPNYVWAKEVYGNDIRNLDESDMVFVMYTGHRSTSWELGYAMGQGKVAFVYIPDWAKDNDMSLMVLNGKLDGYIDESGIHGMTDEYLKIFNQK